MWTRKALLKTVALLFLPATLLAGGQENADPALPVGPEQSDVMMAPGGEPECHDPTLLPLFPRAYGKTAAEWSAEWWQWALSAPLDMNPILDLTGEHGHVGQHGPVWFLAATFGDPPGSPPTERTVEVPRGKALFFPVMNAVWYGPEDNTNPEEDNYFELVQELRDLAVASVGPDTLVRLECRIDGLELDLEDLLERQAESPVFTFTPAPSLWQAFGYEPGPQDLNVSFGYWIFLKPLSPGRHTIEWHAEIDSPLFGNVVQNVIYDLRVRWW